MNMDIIDSIKEWLIAVLSSPILGSIVGILGLLVSIWSLIETKKVKAYVEKEKTEAINKYQFNDSKQNFIKQLEKQIKSIKELERLTSTVCNELMTLTQRILQYEGIFSEEDTKYLGDSKEIFKILSSKTEYDTSDYTTIIERSTQIIVILKKGEYAK